MRKKNGWVGAWVCGLALVGVWVGCSPRTDIGVGSDGGSGGEGGSPDSGSSGSAGSSTNGGDPGGGNGGTTMSGGASAASGTGGGTGGSTVGEAGMESGGTGGTAPPRCGTDCEASGWVCDVDTLECICPPEKPDQCSKDGMRCTNVMGDDDDHCGDCATACPATAVCNDGACSASPEAIYWAKTGSFITSNLVLSGDTLYWGQLGQVLSMAVTGGPVASVVLAPPTTTGAQLSAVLALQLNGANLYAYDRNTDFTPPSLYRIPLSGEAPERIVREGGIAQSARAIYDFAVQDGVVYYTVGADVKSVPADATEGTGTVVASAASPGNLYGVAVDGSLLFWTGPESKVEGDLISGGNRRTLGTSQAASLSLTTDGAHVYWADGATLQRRVYDASTEPETIATAQGDIKAFAINATTAYLVSRDASGVAKPDRLEKATFGGKSRAIARGKFSSLVVGESGVYWATGYNIMRADL
jgi:hypothetical protein